VEDDIHVVFGQKFPGEIGIVRWCIVIRQQPILLLPKFGREVLTHFHTLNIKHHSNLQNRLFALQG
jgi:hypothetical protein